MTASPAPNSAMRVAQVQGGEILEPRVGVTTTHPYELKRIDQDDFEDA